MTRDPRTDPQPGDLFSRDGIACRVIKREGERVLVSSGTTRYWMRVDRWREWCERSGAEAAAVVNQEE